MRTLTSCTVVAATLVASLAPAVADERHDNLAFELQEYTGSYAASYVLGKLTTFKVGDKCWDKLPDANLDPLHAASYYTRDILAYAKVATGDDWSRIETQNNNDRENNKKLVEPMVDAFRSRFHLTIIVDGDDCVAEQGALWIRYWTTIGTSIAALPAQPKLDITLHVTPNVKTITTTISKGVVKIVAPRDIEPKAWDEGLAKPFRKLGKK